MRSFNLARRTILVDSEFARVAVHGDGEFPQTAILVHFQFARIVVHASFEFGRAASDADSEPSRNG
jgi:hypothetical protein